MALGGIHAEYRPHWGYAVTAAKFWHYVIMTGMTKSFSIFIPYLVHRMGASYAAIGLVCGLPESLGSLVGPVMTYLLKRTSPRQIGMVGALLTSVGLIASAFCTNIVTLGICMAANSLGHNAMLLAICVSVNLHFPVKFGVLNTMGIIGSPAGGFLIPPIAQVLFQTYGLEGALLILGAMQCNTFAFAAALRPPRRRSSLRKPEYEIVGQYKAEETETIANGHEFEKDAVHQKAEEAGRSNSNCVEVVRNEERTSVLNHLLQITNLIVLKKRPSFLLILIADLLLTFVAIGWSLFLVPHAEFLGLDQNQATFVVLIGGIGGTIGVVTLSGFLLAGRDLGLRPMVVISFLCSLTFFLDLASSSLVFQSIHSFIVGLLIYQQNSYMALAVKVALPDEHFEMGVGLSFFAYGIGSMLGSFGSGLIYDMTHDYKLVFVTFGVIQVLILLCHVTYQLLYRRRRRWSEYTGSTSAETSQRQTPL